MRVREVGRTRGGKVTARNWGFVSWMTTGFFMSD